jgi:hypothetical protein
MGTDLAQGKALQSCYQPQVAAGLHLLEAIRLTAHPDALVAKFWSENETEWETAELSC